MPTSADDLRPWLGPAWDDLTPDQRNRLAAESDQIGGLAVGMESTFLPILVLMA